MANIFDIASYILSTHGDMSAMKLQKLCYYAQAWSLVWDNKPLCPEKFEAWKNGPVCRELYDRTKGKFVIAESDEQGNPENLDSTQKETVDAVLEYYGDKDAQWLNRLAQTEHPWKMARDSCKDEDCCSVISLESMFEYYDSLQD